MDTGVTLSKTRWIFSGKSVAARQVAVLLTTVYLFTANNPVKCDNFPMGGRSAGMGQASTAVGDLWSVQNNQAGLADCRKYAASLYIENRFMVTELRQEAFAFSCPVTGGILACLFSRTGGNLLNEKKCGIAYARTFGKCISAGIQLDYLTFSDGENTKRGGNLTFEAGIRSKLNRNLAIGCHVFNPCRSGARTGEPDRIPTILKAGLSYDFSGKILSTAEIEKSLTDRPLLRTGIEYRFRKEACLRFGVSTAPFTDYFGFGLELKNLVMDFAASYHPVLGFSPQFSLTYQFRRKN